MACLSTSTVARQKSFDRPNATANSRRYCTSAHAKAPVAACRQPVAPGPAAASKSSIAALQPANRISSSNGSSGYRSSVKRTLTCTAASASVPGMPSRLAPEFDPAVQQLLSKAMSGASFSFWDETAHQEKCLLLLLVDQEPEARQLLHQHLVVAEKGKLGQADELTSRNFPGSAFSLIMTFRHFYGDIGVEGLTSATAGSISTDNSSADASADKPADNNPQPSAGWCKALEATLFITRQHGLPDVSWAALLWGLLSASLAEEEGLPFCPADVREELDRVIYKQAAVQKLIAAAAVKLGSNASTSAASSLWWEANSSSNSSHISSSNSSSSWIDQSLTLALSVAGKQLRDEPVSAATSAAHMVCSSISSAAAHSYRPTDTWLQRAWQLLERALSTVTGKDAMTNELSEAAVSAAYASAAKFGFTSSELTNSMQCDTVRPPGFTEDEHGYVTGYRFGDSWLQWLRTLTTPGVLVTGVLHASLSLAHVGRFAAWDAEALNALAASLQRARPQLQAEALTVLSTEDMVDGMFSEDSTEMPRYVFAALLGALAKGLSRPLNDGSSSSSSSAGISTSLAESSASSGSSSSKVEGGCVLSEVSQNVLLQLASAMPVLLRSIAVVITPEPLDTGKGYGYDTERMLATAGQLVVLAQRLAAYTSRIRPAQLSTAQLVHLNAALDAVLPAASDLAAAADDRKLSATFYSADWPQLPNRQLFSLLTERMAHQEQPAAALVMAVTAGLAARCSAGSDASGASGSDAVAAALALKTAGLPDMSVHVLAEFMGDVVNIAEGSPTEDMAFSSLISHWRKQLPAYIMPVVISTLEALPADLDAATGRDNAAQAPAAGLVDSLQTADAIDAAQASAEAAVSVLVSIEQLDLPVPSITMELLQRLLPRLLMLIEPGRVGDVLGFVAQQQEQRMLRA